MDKSNRAKYTYERKGILDKIEHIKIANKAIIVKNKDFLKISDVLKEHRASVKTWDIEIKAI